MLPLSYFERLSRAHGLRSSGLSRERRGGVRVDVRGRGVSAEISGGTAGAVEPLRVREVSRTGASLVAQRKWRVGAEMALGIEARGEPTVYWCWCKVHRCVGVDGLFVVGVEFLRILQPEVGIKGGTKVEALAWVDVQGAGAPGDPFGVAA